MAGANGFSVSLGTDTLNVVSAIAGVRAAVEESLPGAFTAGPPVEAPQWTLDVRFLDPGQLAEIAEASTSAKFMVEEGQVEDRLLHFSADEVVVARAESRHGGPYLVKADHRARRWTLHIASDTLRDLRWVPRMVRLYFGALLQANGCAFVHAALVEWEGHGILFAGTSGSGKTSLSYLACSRVGARFLSDDTTVVRLTEDGGVRVFGWPRRVAVGLSILTQEPVFDEIRRRRLRREGLDFSMPTSDVIPTDWVRKNRVAFDPAEFLEIFGFQTAPSARPALVVLPKATTDHAGWTIGDAPPSNGHKHIEPCDLRQMEYVTDFLGVTPHGRPRPDGEALARLEALPAVAVRYGSAVVSDFGRFWEEVVCSRLPSGT